MSDPFRAKMVAEIGALRGFARTLVMDRDRAEDLVQEALMKAWTNRARFDLGTNMRAWLFTILRNSFYSQMRKRKREVEDADGALAARLTAPAGQEAHMALDEFRRALRELPDDQREALVLVGASGFSYDEAAEICGVAIGTIKSRVNRARKRLAEQVGPPDPDHAPTMAMGR